MEQDRRDKRCLFTNGCGRKGVTMSRPQIITKEIIEEICNYIAAGHSYAKSAKLAGIAESTFFRWRTMGQLEGAEDIYTIFYIETQDASDFSESEALQLVRSSAILERNWRAAAWFLERRFPDKYSKRPNQHPQDGNDDGQAILAVV
jgi:transposase